VPRTSSLSAQSSALLLGALDGLGDHDTVVWRWTAQVSEQRVGFCDHMCLASKPLDLSEPSFCQTNPRSPFPSVTIETCETLVPRLMWGMTLSSNFDAKRKLA
jgi:hypothetical protein